jgi:hypothetical protein
LGLFKQFEAITTCTVEMEIYRILLQITKFFWEIWINKLSLGNFCEIQNLQKCPNDSYYFKKMCHAMHRLTTFVQPDTCRISFRKSNLNRDHHHSSILSPNNFFCNRRFCETWSFRWGGRCIVANYFSSHWSKHFKKLTRPSNSCQRCVFCIGKIRYIEIQSRIQ